MATAAGEYTTHAAESLDGEPSWETSLLDVLLPELTGAESAVVVNNDAAATLLTLATVAGRPGGPHRSWPRPSQKRRLPFTQSGHCRRHAA